MEKWMVSVVPFKKSVIESENYTSVHFTGTKEAAMSLASRIKGLRENSDVFVSRVAQVSHLPRYKGGKEVKTNYQF